MVANDFSCSSPPAFLSYKTSHSGGLKANQASIALKIATILGADKSLLTLGAANQKSLYKNRLTTMLPKERRIQLSPLEDALKALGVDYTTAATRLQQKGVSLEEIVIFEDLWRHHDMDAEEVIDMLLE